MSLGLGWAMFSLLISISPVALILIHVLSSPEIMVVLGWDFTLVTAVGSLCYQWRMCEDVDVGPCQDMVYILI